MNIFFIYCRRFGAKCDPVSGHLSKNMILMKFKQTILYSKTQQVEIAEFS